MKRLYGDDVDKTTVPGMDQLSFRNMPTYLHDFKGEDVLRKTGSSADTPRAPASGLGITPSLHCLPHGIPLSSLLAEVSKIVQTPGLTIILYEADNTHRQILRWRKLPEDPDRHAGYSVGRWERDTLAWKQRDSTTNSWLDLSGHSHSEALRVTERYHRRDFGHMDIEMTFETPKCTPGHLP